MTMKKKIGAMSLALCMLLGMLSGCSKKDTFQSDAAAISV